LHEDELKEQFKGSPIEKYMSSELNYLQQQLLKSMFNFHLESNSERKLYKSILFIDILIEKGYPKRATKILRQAKKMAYKNEDFTTLLKLIQLEEDIFFKEGILGFTKKISELQQERSQVYQ